MNRIILFLFAVSLMSPISCFSQSPKQDKHAVSAEIDPAELTLEQQLQMPAVPEKTHKNVAAYMHREAESLYKLGYRIETMRKGEIVIATIPTDELFLPNDTTLIASQADKLLKPFVSYLKTPGRYKILMTVHTDNTGKPEYTFNLAESRIMSLYDWFDSNGGKSSDLFGFPVGAENPLVDNNTRANRSKNRRIEIFIVPNYGLINSLKSKK